MEYSLGYTIYQTRRKLILLTLVTGMDMCRDGLLIWSFNGKLICMIDFIAMIDHQSLKPDIDDAMMWRFNSDGVYSTKCFCLSMEKLIVNNSIGSPSTCLAWKGLALPQMKILVWFLLQGSLNIRERLIMLKVIPLVAAVYPLCVMAMESIAYLFFECNCSWKVWADSLA